MDTDLTSAPPLGLGAEWRSCHSAARMTTHQSKLLYFRYLQVLWCFCSFELESTIPYKLRDLLRHKNGICSPRCQPVVNSWQDTIHMVRSIGQDMPYLLLPDVPTAVSRGRREKSTRSTALLPALWDTDQPSCSRDKETWIHQLNIRGGRGEALMRAPRVSCPSPTLPQLVPNTAPHLEWGGTSSPSIKLHNTKIWPYVFA